MKAVCKNNLKKKKYNCLIDFYEFSCFAHDVQEEIISAIN